MTDQTNLAEAEVLSALNTLMKQLEAEQSWIVDLRKSLSQSEKRAERLLASVEAGMYTLSIPQRRDFHLRLRRMQISSSKTGRPAQSDRQKTMLHYIAEKAEGTVTTAEMRLHLKSRNMRGSAQYVSNQMGRWIEEGLLSRLSHGLYQINEQNAALRSIRFRKDRTVILEELRESLNTARAGLGRSVSPFDNPPVP
jgi:hypothetical protein